MNIAANKIVELRLAAGLTQKELAQKAGIAQAAVTRMENGISVGRPTLGKLAAGLGVSIDELLTDENVDYSIHDGRFAKLKILTQRWDKLRNKSWVSEGADGLDCANYDKYLDCLQEIAVEVSELNKKGAFG